MVKQMNIMKIRPRIWHIEESYRVYCTLIQGKHGSILFDTGLGKQDLYAFLKNTLKTDYIVICSHGHHDHTGGIDAFEKVCLHPEDTPLLLPGPLRSGLLHPVFPGDRFDLGDLHAEVVSLKGHTKGSIGLLIPEERLLLAGDALSERLQLLGPGTASLEELRGTLTFALQLPFDTFLAGHYPGEIPKSQISAHLAHLNTFRWEETAEARFGDLPCLRSTFHGPEGRSVFLFDEVLRERSE